MGQIFWTHTDSDRTQFNYSEILGNSTAVAISEAYYPDHRNAANAVGELGTQIGVDMASNVLKEFWPDIAGRSPGSISDDGADAPLHIGDDGADTPLHVSNPPIRRQATKGVAAAGAAAGGVSAGRGRASS